MSRCPYLEYESRGALFSQGDYYCDLCKKSLKNVKLITNAIRLMGMNMKNVPFTLTESKKRR